RVRRRAGRPSAGGCRAGRPGGPGPLSTNAPATAVDTADLDYDLPAGSIAQEPIEPRDAARLLVDQGPGRPPVHTTVASLAELVEPGAVLVVNDTRVLPARLHLRKPTGGAVEVLLLERRPDGAWEALVRPSRRVAPGTVLEPA